MSAQDPWITVGEDGPYLVSGRVPLKRQVIGCDANGESVEWQEGERFPDDDVYALCRCGHSKGKPFCDGTHAAIGFDGAETAARGPRAERAEVCGGTGVTLTDAKDLCSEARFCAARGKLWRIIDRTDDAALRAQVIEQTGLCPSGRYVVLDPEGRPIEPVLEQSIGLVGDPGMGASGGLWVQGGIPVRSSDGHEYEVRNRVTLCRCGESKNKPFCDGSHLGAGFTDEG